MSVCLYSCLSCTANKAHFFHAALFDAFPKFRKATISFVMSPCLYVRLHRTTSFPLNGFSVNFVFADFSKICRENSISLKYDKNNDYFT
jgi:hypothetical protein